MLVKTRGIIFRSVKYRETSLILDIYTRELGLKTYVINGVRKKNARTKAAILQVMNLVDLNCYDQLNRDINRIKEVRPAYLYRELPFKIEKSSVGLFILEIVRKTIREKEANQKLFDFLENTFLFLDQMDGSIANFHISFLLHFSAELGFFPENNYTEQVNCFDLREGVFIQSAPLHNDYIATEESRILHEFLSSEMQDHVGLKLSKGQRNRVLEKLIDFYRIQLGDFGSIKSLEVFRDIFN